MDPTSKIERKKDAGLKKAKREATQANISLFHTPQIYEIPKIHKEETPFQDNFIHRWSTNIPADPWSTNLHFLTLDKLTYLLSAFFRHTHAWRRLTLLAEMLRDYHVISHFLSKKYFWHYKDNRTVNLHVATKSSQVAVYRDTPLLIAALNQTALVVRLSLDPPSYCLAHQLGVRAIFKSC